MKKIILIFLVFTLIFDSAFIGLAVDKNNSGFEPRSTLIEELRSTDKTSRITGDYDSKNAQQFRGLMPDKTCIRLYQSDFSNLNTNLVISYSSGCVELMEDITFNYGIILSDGSDGFYFTCNNHWLRGSPSTDGIIAFNDVTIRDCIVMGRYIGFVIHDNTRVENGEAFSNIYGFLAYNNAVIDNSWARGNLNGGFIAFDQVNILNSQSWQNNKGFELQDEAVSVNSVAQSNLNSGFQLWGSAQVFRGLSRSNYEGYELMENSVVSMSTASESEDEGFEMFDLSRVYDSLSKLNSQGYDMHTDSMATSSTATQNGDGFILRERSNVLNTISTNNNMAGYYMRAYSKAIDSRASNNERYGFEQYENSLVDDSTATHNKYAGFILRGSSSIYDSLAQYNNDNTYTETWGFYLTYASKATNIRSDNNYNGIYVDQGTQLLVGNRVCNNDAENIFVNGGYVEGRFITGPIGGAGNWQNAVIVPCGGGGASPLFLKSERVTIGQSPKNSDWTILVIAVIAMILIFAIYRNFSAYRINRDRMNTKRRR